MKGTELTSWRQSKGLSKSALARALGLSRWSIIRYEASDDVPQVVVMALPRIRGKRPSNNGATQQRDPA